MVSSIKNIDYDSMEFKSIDEDLAELEYDDEDFDSDESNNKKNKDTDTDLVA